MNSILSDVSKFQPIPEDTIRKCITSIEDKINYFLTKLKSCGTISRNLYSDLRVSGSGPGVMYGLPKIHKPDFSTKLQYRPILAAFKLASYHLCKFLVPILSPLTSNEFTLENSEQFANFIQSV